jgi:hypothetical protein
MHRGKASRTADYLKQSFQEPETCIVHTLVMNHKADTAVPGSDLEFSSHTPEAARSFRLFSGMQVDIYRQIRQWCIQGCLPGPLVG